MVELNELLVKMKTDWGSPKVAVHRGAEIPFKLRCSFNKGAEKKRLFSVNETMPEDAKCFYQSTDGATLFSDDEFGQWGLKLYSLSEIGTATSDYFNERGKDCLEGDLVIGEFLGDPDLLLLRCDRLSNDYGSIVVVSAIDPRSEWEVVAKDFVSFLQNLFFYQGDKYWNP